jgi:hypothetical protein
MRRTMYAVLILIMGIFAAPISAHAHHLKQSNAASMPVTTASAEARSLYEKGMQDKRTFIWSAATTTGERP